MSNNGRFDILGQPQPTALSVAAPLNDVQLIAFIAGGIYARDATTATPARAVSVATEIVAEAIVQHDPVNFRRVVEAKRRALEAGA